MRALNPFNLIFPKLLILIAFFGISSKVWSQEIEVTGNVYRLITGGFASCFNLNLNGPHGEFIVEAENIDTEETFSTSSNSNSGEYILNLPNGTYNFYIRSCPSASYIFDVSTLDLIFIQLFIVNPDDYSFECPFITIAADASNDYSITTFDLVLFQDVIVDNSDQFPAPNWRFYPLDYIQRKFNKWDQDFVDSLWNLTNASDLEKISDLIFNRPPTWELEFDADPGWNQMYFRYDINGICKVKGPDFMAVKTGDVKSESNNPGPWCSSQALEYPNQKSSGMDLNRRKMEQKTPIINPGSITGSNRVQNYEYILKFFVEDIESMVGYQLALNIEGDFEKFCTLDKTGDRVPNKWKIYNDNEEILGNGLFITSWIMEEENFSRGVDAREETHLFSVKLYSEKEFEDLNELQELLSIDESLLKLEFVQMRGGKPSIVENPQIRINVDRE